ncbi:MAG: ammonium transporter [Lachnospiraceae bacterium]|nr:ammonium transporter [Lachnospiraceae bacterium]
MNINVANTVFLFAATAMIFFMQAGFAMLETGFTRAKNTGNIIMKNVIDFAIGSVAFTLVGFGLMYGNGLPVIGDIAGIASAQNYGTAMLPEGVPFFLFVIFQTVFAGTAATIVSGGMAERTKFSAYCIISLVLSLFVYPIEARWIWSSQGWLHILGFHDFSGGTAVHLCGGLTALLGAWFLGPRIGKYDKEGKPRAIQGHNIAIAALGLFILWFGWFGFTGGMVQNLTADSAEVLGKVLVNMNLSAATCVCTVVLTTWIKYGKSDVPLSLNGILMGLVVITPAADTVSAGAAMLMAILAGIAMVFGVEFVDEVLKIDDPVGAFTIHGIGGAMGTLLVGFFSDGTGTDGHRGLLLGGGLQVLGIQLLGVIAVAVWVGGVMYLVFKAVKKSNGLRVEPEDELIGLDESEHALGSAYPNFTLLPDATEYFYIGDKVKQIELTSRDETPKDKTAEKPTGTEEAVPAGAENKKELKLTQVTVICNQAKLEALKEGLNQIGITGITITNVMGCGVQKGSNKYFRGIPVGMQLLPKVRVDVVVSKVSVARIVDVTRKILYTGNIGDGKIFVYDVENVIKVRTGEEGYAALQYSDVIWDEKNPDKS